MGGRGTGVNIFGNTPVGRLVDGKTQWLDVIADFNAPGAGHKEVRLHETLQGFAAASQKRYNDNSEVMAIVNDDGFVFRAAKGSDGKCEIDSEAVALAQGNHFTHYHNRNQLTPQMQRELAADNEDYKKIIRAKNRVVDSHKQRARIDAERDKLYRQALRLSRANDEAGIRAFLARTDVDAGIQSRVRSRMDERDAKWRERQNAQRRYDRAKNDFQTRVDEYVKKNNLSSGGRIDDSKQLRIYFPEKAVSYKDETGWVGGPPSWQDINCPMMSFGVRSFNAGCAEGNYMIHPMYDHTQSPTENQDRLRNAQGRIKNLFGENPKSKEAKDFQKRIRAIDLKTNEEGGKKGWDKRKRRAISFNRQMAYLWETEKKILAENGISATFTPNPGYKPTYTED